MALEVHHRVPGKVLAADGAALMAVIGSQSTNDPADIAAVVELIEYSLSRYPCVALLLVAEHGAPSPTGDERRMMQEALTKFGDRLVVGYAFCGLGFWMSTVRRVVVSISRLTKSPLIAYGNVEQTAQHLALEVVGLDAQRMVRNAEELRAEVTATDVRAAG